MKLNEMLNIRQKLTLATSAFAVLSVVLAYFFVSGLTAQIRFAEQELRGNAYIRAVLPVFRDTLLLREEQQNNGGEHGKFVGQLNVSLAAFRPVHESLAAPLELDDAILRTKQQSGLGFVTLQGELNDAKNEVAALFMDNHRAAYKKLVGNLRSLIGYVGDTSNLILDPEFDTYYYSSSVVQVFPRLIERLADVTSMLLRLKYRSVITDSDRNDLAIMTEMLNQMDLNSVNRTFDKIRIQGRGFDGLPPGRQALTVEKLAAYRASVQNFVSILDPDTLIDASLDVRQKSFEMWSVALDNLDILLQNRIQRYEQRLWGVILSCTLGFLATAAFAFSVQRGITVPLKVIQDRMLSLSRDDTSTEVQYQGRGDEIGDMARALEVFRKNIIEKQRLTGISFFHQLLKTVLDNVADGILLINCAGVIENANQACGALSGYRQEELIGSNVSMLMPAPYRAAHDGYLAKYLATGKGAIIGIGRAVPVQRKDGTVFDAQLSVAEIRSADRAYFLGIFQDISSQKKYEKMKLNMLTWERHAHHEKLEALAKMVGGLAHEIGNALQPILGMSEILREEQRGVNPDLYESADLIWRNAERVRLILNDIRTYVRKNSKESQLLDLYQLLDEMIHHAEEFLPAGVKIVWQGGGQEHAPLQAVVNRTEMLQIINNLAMNASYAMNDNGKIEITLGKTRVSGPLTDELNLPEGDYAILSLKDEGRGMTEEVKKNLFQPFFTTKPVGRGTGLGLAAVYGIVMDWRGAIRVESAPGKGATFHIYIPLFSEQSEE